MNRLLLRQGLCLALLASSATAIRAQDVDPDQRALSSSKFGAWSGKSVATVRDDGTVPSIPQTCILRGDGVTLRVERRGFVQVWLDENANGFDLAVADGVEIDRRSYLMRRTSSRIPDDSPIQISSFQGFFSILASPNGAWLPISGVVTQLVQANSVIFYGQRDGKPYRSRLALNGLLDGISWCDIALKYQWDSTSRATGRAEGISTGFLKNSTISEPVSNRNSKDSTQTFTTSSQARALESVWILRLDRSYSRDGRVFDDPHCMVETNGLGFSVSKSGSKYIRIWWKLSNLNQGMSDLSDIDLKKTWLDEVGYNARFFYDPPKGDQVVIGGFSALYVLMNHKWVHIDNIFDDILKSTQVKLEFLTDANDPSGELSIKLAMAGARDEIENCRDYLLSK